MALDDAGAADAAPEGHGGQPAPAGKPKGKGRLGFLSGPHGTEIIVISSVVLVLFAFLSLKKKPSGYSADGTTSATQAAYLGGAGNVAGFDQAAVQGLTQQLNDQNTANAGAFQSIFDSLDQQKADQDAAAASWAQKLAAETDALTALQHSLSVLPQPVGGTPAAAPSIASTLFAPKLTGQYVRYTGTGAYGEVESDGSIYGISTEELGWDQWAKIFPSASPIGPSTPTNYSDRVTNLAAAAPPKK